MSVPKYIYAVIAGLLLSIPSVMVGQSGSFHSFEVQPGAGCTVLIRWEASAGVDTLNYEVERSSDRQNWKVIARERIRASHKYVVFDTQPVDSLNYYRVKLVSTNKINIYSQVKSINLVRALEIYIWPIPSSEMLSIKLDSSQSCTNTMVLSP